MRILVLTLFAFACSTKPTDPLATLNLKNLQFDFKLLTPLDSLETTALVKSYLEHEWEPEIQEISSNLPKSYIRNNLNLSEHRRNFIRDYIKTYNSYWIRVDIGTESKEFILTSNGKDPENWIHDSYELILYYPYKQENELTPVFLGRYWHFMAITEYEQNAIIKFYDNGNIQIENVSNHCSDVLTDKGLNCQTITITTNFEASENWIEKVSTDTVRTEI